MAPETVLEELELPLTDLTRVTRKVEEASGLVARYLNFRPEYTTWEETFTGVNGDRLYLGARPAWAVESLVYRDGSTEDASTYVLGRGPYGESAIIRPGQVGYYPDPWSPWIGSSTFTLSGGPLAVPDWTVTYTAGWWLEEMTGTMPAGVEPLPPEIKSDFLKVVRWLRATSGNLGNLGSLGISKMANDGAQVEFFSAKDQETDSLTGLPGSCTRTLSLYRRAT
jgi:hypothetical protein